MNTKRDKMTMNELKFSFEIRFNRILPVFLFLHLSFLFPVKLRINNHLFGVIVVEHFHFRLNESLQPSFLNFERRFMVERNIL